jgi:biofilm PGA synthesis protein PgaD
MNAPDLLPQHIIYKPGQQPRSRRLIWRVLTLIAWTFYLYLWLPLITLGAWWVSVRLGVEELPFAPESPSFVGIDVFNVLIPLAAIAVILMLGWAEYNRRRFQNLERRKDTPDVTHAESAQALRVSPAVADALRRSRRALVILDQQAIPERVVVQDLRDG